MLALVQARLGLASIIAHVQLGFGNALRNVLLFGVAIQRDYIYRSFKIFFSHLLTTRKKPKPSALCYIETISKPYDVTVTGVRAGSVDIHWKTTQSYSTIDHIKAGYLIIQTDASIKFNVFNTCITFPACL